MKYRIISNLDFTIYYKSKEYTNEERSYLSVVRRAEYLCCFYLSSTASNVGECIEIIT